MTHVTIFGIGLKKNLVGRVLRENNSIHFPAEFRYSVGRSHQSWLVHYARCCRTNLPIQLNPRWKFPVLMVQS
jgi:hypothetical protein